MFYIQSRQGFCQDYDCAIGEARGRCAPRKSARLQGGQTHGRHDVHALIANGQSHTKTATLNPAGAWVLTSCWML